MPQWLQASLAILTLVGFFWGAYRVLRASQDDDPNKRGRDSSEPAGFDSFGGSES